MRALVGGNPKGYPYYTAWLGKPIRSMVGATLAVALVGGGRCPCGLAVALMGSGGETT